MPHMLVPWVSLWHNSHTQLLAHSAWHWLVLAHPLPASALVQACPGSLAPALPTARSFCLLDSPRLAPQFTPFSPIESSTWKVTPITSSFFVFYHSICGDPVSYYVFLFIYLLHLPNKLGPMRERELCFVCRITTLRQCLASHMCFICICWRNGKVELKTNCPDFSALFIQGQYFQR